MPQDDMNISVGIDPTGAIAAAQQAAQGSNAQTYNAATDPNNAVSAADAAKTTPAALKPPDRSAIEAQVLADMIKSGNTDYGKASFAKEFDARVEQEYSSQQVLFTTASEAAFTAGRSAAIANEFPAPPPPPIRSAYPALIPPPPPFSFPPTEPPTGDAYAEYEGSSPFLPAVLNEPQLYAGGGMEPAGGSPFDTFSYGRAIGPQRLRTFMGYSAADWRKGIGEGFIGMGGVQGAFAAYQIASGVENAYAPTIQGRASTPGEENYDASVAAGVPILATAAGVGIGMMIGGPAGAAAGGFIGQMASGPIAQGLTQYADSHTYAPVRAGESVGIGRGEMQEFADAVRNIATPAIKDLSDIVSAVGKGGYIDTAGVSSFAHMQFGLGETAKPVLTGVASYLESSPFLAPARVAFGGGSLGAGDYTGLAYGAAASGDYESMQNLLAASAGATAKTVQITGAFHTLFDSAARERDFKAYDSGSYENDTTADYLKRTWTMGFGGTMAIPLTPAEQGHQEFLARRADEIFGEHQRSVADLATATTARSLAETGLQADTLLGGGAAAIRRDAPGVLSAANAQAAALREQINADQEAVNLAQRQPGYASNRDALRGVTELNQDIAAKQAQIAQLETLTAAQITRTQYEADFGESESGLSLGTAAAQRDLTGSIYSARGYRGSQGAFEGLVTSQRARSSFYTTQANDPNAPIDLATRNRYRQQSAEIDAALPEEAYSFLVGKITEGEAERGVGIADVQLQITKGLLGGRGYNDMAPTFGREFGLERQNIATMRSDAARLASYSPTAAFNMLRQADAAEASLVQQQEQVHVGGVLETYRSDALRMQTGADTTAVTRITGTPGEVFTSRMGEASGIQQTINDLQSQLSSVPKEMGDSFRKIIESLQTELRELPTQARMQEFASGASIAATNVGYGTEQGGVANRLYGTGPQSTAALGYAESNARTEMAKAQVVLATARPGTQEYEQALQAYTQFSGQLDSIAQQRDTFHGTPDFNEREVNARGAAYRLSLGYAEPGSREDAALGLFRLDTEKLGDFDKYAAQRLAAVKGTPGEAATRFDLATQRNEILNTRAQDEYNADVSFGANLPSYAAGGSTTIAAYMPSRAQAASDLERFNPRAAARLLGFQRHETGEELIHGDAGHFNAAGRGPGSAQPGNWTPQAIAAAIANAFHGLSIKVDSNGRMTMNVPNAGRVHDITHQAQGVHLPGVPH